MAERYNYLVYKNKKFKSQQQAYLEGNTYPIATAAWYNVIV